MTNIPEELVERMCALVRAMWDSSSLYYTKEVAHLHAEACKIKVLLPKPVDPDLIEARKIASDAEHDKDFLRGVYDAGSVVQNFLRAIKRGRELERGQ